MPLKLMSFYLSNNRGKESKRWQQKEINMNICCDPCTQPVTFTAQLNSILIVTFAIAERDIERENIYCLFLWLQWSDYQTGNIGGTVIMWTCLHCYHGHHVAGYTGHIITSPDVTSTAVFPS